MFFFHGLANGINLRKCNVDTLQLNLGLSDFAETKICRVTWLIDQRVDGWNFVVSNGEALGPALAITGPPCLKNIRGIVRRPM